MNFVTWSIRNPVPVIVLFIGLTIAGLISFPKLGVLDRPDIEFPAVVVTITTGAVDLQPAGAGRVWVLNSAAPYFVVLGPDGQLERQFGDRGGGPQEFDRPVALVRGVDPAETWTYDWGRNTLIRISGEDRRDLALSRDSIPIPSLVSFDGAGINAAPPWLESTTQGFLLARARITRDESALHLWNAEILRVREDIAGDPDRSILDGLKPRPRKTETTARLHRALDDVDAIVASRRAH